MGAPIFDVFSSVVFSGRIILKHNENRKGLRGSGVMLPRKIFENLHTVVAILVLFEQFLGKFCLNFLPLILNVSPNRCILFGDFRLLSKRFEIMKKLYSSKTCLKMAGGGGMHLPHPPQRSAPDVKIFFWSSPDFSWKTAVLRGLEDLFFGL